MAELPQDNPVSPPRQYEFDPQQDEVIDNLSNSMRWVAAPLWVLGILYAVATVLALVQVFSRPESLYALLSFLLVTLFFLALAGWTVRAADSFKAIAQTRGRDISHLMDALNNLRKLYSMLALIVKVYVAILVISLVVGLVVLASRGFSS